MDKHASRAEHAETIAARNDLFRTSMGQDPAIPGKIYQTYGIEGLGIDAISEIVEKVRTFDDFNEDNDPHGERDFGAFDHAGHRIFWKIDLKDPEYRYHPETPHLPDTTRRVLIIMLSTEY